MGSFFDDLEKILGYQFKDKKLLIEAFNVRDMKIKGKYCKFYKNNYQRLEFLGDSIIETLVVT